MTECEYVGNAAIQKEMKTRICKVDGCSCYNFDEPEIFAKCPTRKEKQKMMKTKSLPLQPQSTR